MGGFHTVIILMRIKIGRTRDGWIYPSYKLGQQINKWQLYIDIYMLQLTSICDAAMSNILLPVNAHYRHGGSKFNYSLYSVPGILKLPFYFTDWNQSAICGETLVASLYLLRDNWEQFTVEICCGESLFYRYIHVQWNLGIRDTQGTVKNCPQFWGGLISQVHFYVLNRPRDWSSCP